MQAGTWANRRGRGPAQRHRLRTGLALSVLAAVVLVAGCASRTTPAPVTHLSTSEEAKRAPKESITPAPSAPIGEPPAGTTYTVVAGDTLYNIARRYGVSVASLASWNQIEDPSQLQSGRVLQLSAKPVAAAPPPVSAATGTKSAATKPVATKPTETKPVANASSGSSTASNAAKPPASTNASNRPASAARASDAKLIHWDWPARGRILQAFNVNTKGIDLEGKLGDPVTAAADGTVMYAGNGVRGLGNLILLGHSDGFISAYAHNQVLLVKTGQTVKQGAQIASIGQSDTTSPRLHFEIRRRGTPVNPLSYLPAR